MQLAVANAINPFKINSTSTLNMVLSLNGSFNPVFEIATMLHKFAHCTQDGEVRERTLQENKNII